MKAVIDGIIEFEVVLLKTESRQREQLEKSVSGLDGVVSIDAGLRERTIIQKGLLRETGRAALDRKAAALSGLIDGMEHRMTTSDGRVFDRLRVDSVKTEPADYSGVGVVCGIEIRYTQLGGM